MLDGRSWPSEKVERKNINELIPYARNSRTHTDHQVSQIAASITEWGFTNPILVDENNQILAGHGRLAAARLLGLKEVPCVIAKEWTDAQKQAYVVADNKLALNAGWDDTLLKILRFLVSDKRKIQDILRRISINQEITFQERIFVENNAKNCSSIFSDLKG